MRTHRGFSMAELMVTVASIGVLSAIAIPAGRDSQFKTKRAEIPANVAGIRTAELGYYAAWSKFLDQSAYVPRELSENGDDRKPAGWPAVDPESNNFDVLGWSPNGEVRGTYSVPIANNEELQIDAACNVDGDSNVATYFATESNNGEWDDDSKY